MKTPWRIWWEMRPDPDASEAAWGLWFMWFVAFGVVAGAFLIALVGGAWSYIDRWWF